MNKAKAGVSAIMALCLSLSSVSFAQGNGAANYPDGPQYQNQNRGGQQGPHANQGRYAPPQGRADPQRSYGHAGYPPGPYDTRGQMQRYERGAGPQHQYHPGGRMPPQYRSHQYVVDDWRGHRLSAPPRGYHWVQTGGDYVLVAIATGIILQLILSN